MWINGQLVLSESDTVKLCAVLVPIISAVITALIAGVTEWLKNRDNSVDLSKTKEGKKLLAYMTEED